MIFAAVSSGRSFSAISWSNCGPSACSTLATPAMRPAAVTAAPAFAPATSTCTSAPHCSAALTVFNVAPLTRVLSCSAMTRQAISDHLRIVLEFGNERGHGWHLDAGDPPGRLPDLQRHHVGRDVDV